jgi:hypothetical protein
MSRPMVGIQPEAVRDAAGRVFDPPQKWGLASFGVWGGGGGGRAGELGSNGDSKVRRGSLRGFNTRKYGACMTPGTGNEPWQKI